MGDQLVYFTQGHKLYADAVHKRKLYPIDIKSLHWNKPDSTLRECEFVKIIGIKYEIRPPRLCCLKLAIMDPSTGRLSTDTFTLKYHDIPDVLDFLVLKQTYDVSLNRSWPLGERFRCIIDDAWWLGTVELHEPYLDYCPDSLFMCYTVTWDNGEKERLSPWDMEPIDTAVEAGESGSGITVRAWELERLRYSWTPEDWQDGMVGEEECARISEGLGLVMGLAVAEPFLAPVDLSAYPNYAMIVEYPMDLNTIKSRLENGFYRRLNAVQFDVRYIATNAEKFNQRSSNIVRQARIVTELCLDLINNPDFNDPTARYHEIAATYRSPNASDLDTSGRSGSAANALAGSSAAPHKGRRGRRKKSALSSIPWQQQCKDVLRTLFERQDSTPFRYPVDQEIYPDYSRVVEIPMDLTSVREEVATQSYESPQQFAADVRLIFTNSKSYNTNKKSKIYSMTLRLEAFFEDKMKAVIASHEEQLRLAKKASSKRSNKISFSPKGTAAVSLTRLSNSDMVKAATSGVASPSLTGSSAAGHTLRSSIGTGTCRSNSNSPSPTVNDSSSRTPTTQRIRRVVGINQTSKRAQMNGQVNHESNDNNRALRARPQQSSDDSDEDYSPVNTGKKRAGDMRSRRKVTEGGGSSDSGESGTGMGVRSRVAVQYQEDSHSELDDYQNIVPQHYTSKERHNDDGGSSDSSTTSRDNNTKHVVVKLKLKTNQSCDNAREAANSSASMNESGKSSTASSDNEADENSQTDASKNSRSNGRGPSTKRKRVLESNSDDENDGQDNKRAESDGNEYVSGSKTKIKRSDSSSDDSNSDKNRKHKRRKTVNDDGEESSSSSGSGSSRTSSESEDFRTDSRNMSRNAQIFAKKKIVPNIGRKMPIYKGSLIPKHRSIPLGKKSQKEDSEFECDDNDIPSSDYSDEEEIKKGKKRKGAKMRGYKRRMAVLDGDDLLDDEDFKVDDNEFIDNEDVSDESSSSSSSEETDTEDSDLDMRRKKNKKKNKKMKHTKGVSNSSAKSGKKIPLKYKSGSKSGRGRHKGKSAGRHHGGLNGRTGSEQKRRRKRPRAGRDDDGKGPPREVRDGEQVIGTVYYDSNASDEYNPTSKARGGSSGKKKKGGSAKKNLSNMGGFKRAIDAFNEEEVRKSSRSQRKVHYDEMYEDDDEYDASLGVLGRITEATGGQTRNNPGGALEYADEDDLNVSSRGRVRRANILMKDFI
uniref:PH-interacting protein isoform X2 n=3 Tax=Hirondellea gigas TaxID=1518452 RepID=A0A6A7G1C5_9CRUS